MSVMSRLALEPDRALCACPRLEHRQFHGAFSVRSAETDRENALSRDAQHNRSGITARDPAAFALYGKRWAWLSRARALGQNLERRRIPTNPPGRATWIKFARRALCAR